MLGLHDSILGIEYGYCLILDVLNSSKITSRLLVQACQSLFLFFAGPLPVPGLGSQVLMREGQRRKGLPASPHSGYAGASSLDHDIPSTTTTIA